MTEPQLTARQAFDRLVEGNARFASDVLSLNSLSSQRRRTDLATGQRPFAIILGCSDSRVPAEFVFDCGLGDLFVIRVAGNVVAPSQVGSVEFAASQFGTRLVVVLGHSACGAIAATIQALTSDAAPETDGLQSIVDLVRPGIEPLLRPDADVSLDELAARAVGANVQESVKRLRSGSPIIERLIAKDGLAVVGAEYSLETGKVEFDSAPD